MKNILIVGETGFIAQRLKADFEEQGFRVIGTSRNKSSNGLYLDLTAPDSIEKFAVPVENLHALVFAQGIKPSRNLKSMTYQHFQDMLNVHLIGPSLLLKKLLPLCEKQALVLFFSSVATRKGSYDPSYAVAKAGILGLVQSLQNEFPEQRFNAISLGLVEDSPVYQGMSEEFRQKHRSHMHNQSLIDVANVVTLTNELLRNKSISRSILPLDGGYN
jgi:3-oxoacyl-[acyl-carrier protein] reductase